MDTAAMRLVLITGATGHIGFRTLVETLKAGYAARVAIRRPEQEDKIRRAKSIERYLDNVSFTLVPDITAPGAYADAIEGVSYVLHVASPIPLKPDVQALINDGKGWKEALYDPAVKGTLEILRAANATPSMKRVVITASGNVLAVATGQPGAGPTDIRRCPTMVEAQAVTTDGQAYKESKILATTAARDFMREQKPSFDLVIVCPGYVQGAHELTDSIEEFRTSTSRATVDVAIGQRLGWPPLAPNVTSQIWVEDVAKAHVAGLDSAKIQGDDVLVLAGNGQNSALWSEVARLVGEWYPEEVEAGILKPVEDQEDFNLPFDGTGTEFKLGWKFSGPEIWAKEVVEQYLSLRKKEAM